MAILWRGDREMRDNVAPESTRLAPVFEALDRLGVAAEPAVYSDQMRDEVRGQLLSVDGVLVWVDPIGGGEDRTKLDALLRDIASEGIFVSAHPDVILKMGTKEVLFRTRDLGWGTDTDLYRTVEELEERFPARLASDGPRVLKQLRGNGGIGTWKVELMSGADDQRVRVQHARVREPVTEDLPLRDFMESCAKYFSGSGCVVDQAFQPRIVEGMIRCYFVEDGVVGFARQKPDEALLAEPTKIMGLPSAKTMYGPSEPEFQTLKARVESEWVPAMQRLLDIDPRSLPVLWDADFLYGPRTEAGHDTYVLCEINVCSVYPFPEQAVEKIAAAAAARLAAAAVVHDTGGVENRRSRSSS
jgi:hypothetical protein